MSPALKNGLLLVLLLGILGASAVFFVRGKKDTTYSSDKSTITRWMCEKCKKHIELTAADYKEWSDSRDKVRIDNKQMTFLCPDCKEFTVKRAWIDDQTGEWVLPGQKKAGAAQKAEGPAPKK